MMFLADECIQKLQSDGVTFERNSDGTLRIPALCPDVGDLIIAFDDDEITVYLGRFTHCHFTPGVCGNAEDPDQVHEAVDTAVEFVSSVMADKFVIWRYPNGGGGCYRLEAERDPMADTPLGSNAQRYLWSGPYPLSGAA